MSYPLCWTVLLHGSIKRSFPTLPPLNPDPFVHNVCCLQRNRILVWTRNVTLKERKRVAPPFVSYASCLFTPIQCPPDPRRLSSSGFFSVVTKTDLRNVLSRAAYESVMMMVASTSWSFRLGWSPAVMCVFRGVVWVSWRTWGCVVPLFVLDSSTYGHHSDVTGKREGTYCTERSVQYFAIILHCVTQYLPILKAS